MQHHALTADLLPRLYSPEALMVYLRRLTNQHLNALIRSVTALEYTHPAHWAAIDQVVTDRDRLYAQGGSGAGWRE